MASLGSLMRLGVLLLLSAVSIQAKPYYSKRDYSAKTSVFNDDYDLPLLPPNPPQSHQPRHDKWMSWKPQVTKAPAVVDAKPPTVVKAESDTIPPLTDPCAAVFCRLGRVCVVNSVGRGGCACAGESYCDGHNKKVCGTDGIFYPSHCELHRMACVKSIHIGIDHSDIKCLTAETTEMQTSDEKVVANDDGIHADIVKKAGELYTPKSPELLDSDESEEEVDEQLLVQSAESHEKEDKVWGSEHQEDDGTEDHLAQASESSELPVLADDIVSVEPECTELEYGRLKNNLLQYHCARVGENDCSEDHSRKQFVANVMFGYYDRNGDHRLTEEELDDIEHRDHLERLSGTCKLTDMLEFDDKEEDGNISISELYAAFRIPTVVLDENLRVFKTVMNVGGSVEMKCDVRGSSNIMWKRNGAALDDLTSDDIKVYEDGSISIQDLSLHHMGNYTCQDPDEDSVVQTHVLTVHMKPHVSVSPSTQFHTTSASVVLRCHAEGVPEPMLSWEMNEAPLPRTEAPGLPDHYLLLHNNSRLEITEAMYTRDTGAYKCKAQNAAGSAQDIATVFIENSNVPSYATDDLHESFVVFHEDGYTIYEPHHCHTEHMVVANYGHFKTVPEYSATPRTLCPSSDVSTPGKCVWGGAVNVKNSFIYVTQPELNRVVVVELFDHDNPIEIIPTDKVPVAIHYVEHLDQVWVVCWNSRDEGVDGGAKTVLVIREASEDSQHHTVHTQPIANHFDLVKDIFLPPNNDHHQVFNYGYVIHNEQQALFKMDLKTMEYVRNIDLSEYACVPQSLVFMPFGGRVVVHCGAPAGLPEKSTRLVIDYITDKVLEEAGLSGRPFVTPDGRHLVTVEGDSNTLSVYRINEEGLTEHMLDEYTTLHISDVAFFPSTRGRGYDLYASASNRNAVLYINLMSGKVDMVEDVGTPLDASEWPWSKTSRVISAGGIFGDYLMTPSRNSVIVLNGRSQRVQCEWQDVNHGNVITWVEPKHL